MAPREMTPRERVYAAANFTEPDRVPMPFGGTPIATIEECPPTPEGLGCTHLYEYLGLKDAEAPAIGDVFNSVTNLDERVMLRFHTDMRSVDANIPRAVIQPDGTKTWDFMCGMRIKKVGLHDEPFEWPMKYMTTKKDIDEYPWPPLDINIMEGVVERARYLHEETDYFVVGDTFTNWFPFDSYGLAFTGTEKWLTDMKLNPKFYHQLSEKLLERALAYADQFYGGVGQYLDGTWVLDDLGMQTGPLMSLADYREFYKPYQAAIIKKIREYIRPEAKIILHSCGSVYYVIPDLIEIGVDILNPVQPLAKNMEPWRLKKEFGGKIAFLGGLDIQQLMPLGTVEQVREGVKKLIQTYAPGGGFIPATAHIIEPDIPVENIVAAHDALYEYGKYPISKLTGQGYVDYIKGLQLH